MPASRRSIGPPLPATPTAGWPTTTWASLWPRGDEATRRSSSTGKPWRIWPGYAQAHFNLASELARCGQVDEAVEHYRRALELDPKYPAAHVGLGLALARRGQLDEATAHFRKALAINPDVADAHSNLGLALEHYGRTEEAIGHYRRALEIDPRHLPARINLGLALARSGRMDEAIEHYQRALRMKPGDAKVHYALGLALVSSGRPDAAVAQFQRALKIDPDNAKVHYGLGFALAACQRLDEAIEHYQRAVELDPRYAEAHNDLGTALARCGRIDEAVAHFRRALEISPQSVEAHNNLGLALAGCGRTAEAIEHYRKALALAQQQNKADMAANLEGKLRLYQPETPAREPPHPSHDELMRAIPRTTIGTIVGLAFLGYVGWNLKFIAWTSGAGFDWIVWTLRDGPHDRAVLGLMVAATGVILVGSNGWGSWILPGLRCIGSVAVSWSRTHAKLILVPSLMGLWLLNPFHAHETCLQASRAAEDARVLQGGNRFCQTCARYFPHRYRLRQLLLRDSGTPHRTN